MGISIPSFNSENLFVLLVSFLQFFFPWVFRNLPKEYWQILASIPGKKRGREVRHGTNYTWYGFFLATAYVFAVLLFLLLMGSQAVPRSASLILVIRVLTICTPMSSIVARLVEGKRFTLTVGGAIFAGLLLAPWVIALLNFLPGDILEYRFPVLATMTAMAIGHISGEGMGRLACISFGCCYGKPLDMLPPFHRKLLAPFGMTFFGKTKKIAYAHGLDGQPVVPVQAMTSVLYTALSLLSIWLSLKRIISFPLWLLSDFPMGGGFFPSFSEPIIGVRKSFPPIR